MLVGISVACLGKRVVLVASGLPLLEESEAVVRGYEVVVLVDDLSVVVVPRLPTIGTFLVVRVCLGIIADSAVVVRNSVVEISETVVEVVANAASVSVRGLLSAFELLAGVRVVSAIVVTASVAEVVPKIGLKGIGPDLKSVRRDIFVPSVGTYVVGTPAVRGLDASNIPGTASDSVLEARASGEAVLSPPNPSWNAVAELEGVSVSPPVWPASVNKVSDPVTVTSLTLRAALGVTGPDTGWKSLATVLLVRGLGMSLECVTTLV